MGGNLGKTKQNEQKKKKQPKPTKFPLLYQSSTPVVILLS